MSVADQLAEIAARKQANLATAQQVPENLAKPTETRLAEAASNAGQLQKPVTKPEGISDADWASMPSDVQALVALGPEAQAAPVSPPEAAQGLAASATGAPLEAPPKEEKPKRTRARKPAEPPANLDVLIAEVKALRTEITAAIKEQTQAILGVAELLIK